jgi:chitinase
MVYPVDYPTAPLSSGMPAYSAPASSMASEHAAVPEASKAAEYSAHPVVPEASKAASSSAAQEYPAVPAASSSSSAAGYPSLPIASEYPKKPVEEEVTSTVHMTLTRVPIAASTAAPYPTSAGGASYAPIGSGSAMPTDTGMPTMPSAYAPPEFEGVASRAGVGLTMMVAVVGAFLVL